MDKNFDMALLGRLLANANIKLNLQYRPETVSTQTDARKYIEKNGVQETLFITDGQTAGHGRLNRAWFDAGKKSLCCSLLFRPKISLSKIPLINYAAALAMKQLVLDIGLDAELKWPNDILIKGRKLCGIISETALVCDSLFFVITGIGLNINSAADDFPSELQGTATSLKIETQKDFSREKLAVDFLLNFINLIKLLEGNSCKLLENYRKNCDTIGHRVKAIFENGEFEGVAQSINSDGSLLINKNGEKKSFFAADIVHLRNA